MYDSISVLSYIANEVMACINMFYSMMSFRILCEYQC
jgi:hypothetical protein